MVLMINTIFYKIGKRTLDFLQEFGQVMRLLTEIVISLPKIILKPRNFIYQMEHIGVNSMPLVLIIAIFTGAVTSWQAAYQLKGVAPLSFLGVTATRAIIMELGPVLTAIVIAGRVGASIAAELGSMKVTEQIDALDSMGINPVAYLAAPRFFASIIMMPILIIFANTIAIFGAFFISNYFLGVPFGTFFDPAKRFFHLSDFSFGMMKGMIFGGLTALLGCHIGFKTEGGAEGVGLSTIRSFVISSALILIFDYVLWTMFF
jgi:phospholipid/cholesterol/gamma-HCH transport system permease protein